MTSPDIKLMLAKERNAMLWFWFKAFPGTLVHELCHFIIAWLTASRPSSISIIPVKQGDYWQLGSVAFIPGLLTAGLVALAPPLMMPVLASVMLRSTLASGLGWAVVVPACLWLIHGAMPSRADVLIALKYPLSWPLVYLAGWADYQWFTVYIREIRLA